MQEHSKIENYQQKKIVDYLEKHAVDAILLHSTVNRLWYSEFSSSEGYLLITKDDAILYLDGRYITDGKQKAKNVTNVLEMGTNNPGGFYATLNQLLIEKKIKTLGFESDYLTYLHYQTIAAKLPVASLKPIDFSELRAIKTKAEIKLLRRACEIGDIAINNVIKNIKPGMREKKIEEMILQTFMEQGAEKASFDTIVASGIRGALPHGRASDKVINNNELVTIDFGCVFEGYCSDTTRTIGLGNPSAQMREIFDVVYQAQKLGIEAIKPGVSAAHIDQICREYIFKKGYGEYFTHSTGHGVGIEIHEFPRVSQFCDILLEPGMVITVEPGIYIPAIGGVRIEDDILVTIGGYEVLTKAPRGLVLV